MYALWIFSKIKRIMDWLSIVYFLLKFGIHPELWHPLLFSKNVTPGTRKGFGNRADAFSPWFPGKEEIMWSNQGKYFTACCSLRTTVKNAMYVLAHDVPRVAIAEFHHLGGLSSWNLFSYKSAGWKSKIKMSAVLVSSEASLLDFQMNAFSIVFTRSSLYANIDLICLCLCPNLPLL
jgi:hypothetical protein